MKFRLFYEGPLKGNRSNAREKDCLRNYFSPQLSELWVRDTALASLLQSTEQYYEPKEVGGSHFRAVAIKKLNLHCELDFLILSPQEKTQVIFKGDLDNRVKTVIDSLRMPQQSSEVTEKLASNDHRNPICVLLEDDSLVSKISATADILLGCQEDQLRNREVKLIISVHIYPKTPSFDAASLIG